MVGEGKFRPEVPKSLGRRKRRNASRTLRDASPWNTGKMWKRLESGQIKPRQQDKCSGKGMTNHRKDMSLHNCMWK